MYARANVLLLVKTCGIQEFFVLLQPKRIKYK